MAVLKSMPQMDVVDAFHGVLDFYRWCELVIVRKWPVFTVKTRSVPVQETAVRFAYPSTVASLISPEVIDAYKTMVSGYGLSWKDMMTRCYISGDKMYEERP